MDFPHIPDLKTFDERMAYYAEARTDRDRWSWVLGFGAFSECSVRPNGGKPGPEDFTLAKFARALNEEPSVIGEWRNNYQFWIGHFPAIPENASWRQCADARRKSGWRPGADITPDHIRHALQFLTKAIDEGAPRAPDPRPAWRRKLDRAVNILAGVAADPETPALVALAVRTLIGQVKPE